MSMRTSAKGICEIMAHEGIVTMPYKDSVGVWTFGVGHTASAGSPDPAKMAKGVERPLEEVLTVFMQDLKRFEDRVNDAVKVPLKQHEFDALVSFDFNTGGIYRAKLTQALNRGDWQGAVDGFLGWLKPPEVAGRRRKEQALFRSGTYTSGGYAQVYPANESGRVLFSSGVRTYVGATAERLVGAAGQSRRADAATSAVAGGAAAGGGSAVLPTLTGVDDLSWAFYLIAAAAAVGVAFFVWRAVQRNSAARAAVSEAARLATGQQP